MRTIAFYLPQFHTIPENDMWWGEGFTEWTNTRRALAQFEGHSQPRMPGELGEYCLLDRGTLRAQSDLARSAGIDAFCMYFYWFDGRRLLEKPVDLWAAETSLLPYCLSWANEAWTRRWDGKERDVLMPQTYSEGFEVGLFESLLPHFRQPHYLKQHDLPILVVHRPNLIPNARRFSTEMRRLARAADLPGLHIIGAETQSAMSPDDFGFDAMVEFPPVGHNTLSTALLKPAPGVSPAFKGRLMSYARLVRRCTERREPAFVRYRGVAPGWDNTPRRMERATVYHGSTPQLYHHWLGAARAAETARRGEAGLVFINAWNEWAEGAYLEPDTEHGRSFLDATRDSGTKEAPVETGYTPRWLWSFPQVRSLLLCAGGSGLQTARYVMTFARRLRMRARRAGPSQEDGLDTGPERDLRRNLCPGATQNGR